MLKLAIFVFSVSCECNDVRTAILQNRSTTRIYELAPYTEFRLVFRAAANFGNAYVERIFHFYFEDKFS